MESQLNTTKEVLDNLLSSSAKEVKEFIKLKNNSNNREGLKTDKIKKSRKFNNNEFSRVSSKDRNLKIKDIYDPNFTKSSKVNKSFKGPC